MPLRFAVACMPLLTLVCALSSADIQIDTGHQAAIVVLEYDESRDLIFSASKDGTVKIWNSGSGKLLHSLLGSHLAIRRMAYHPTLPQIATLEVFGPDSSRISVWDWQKKRQLYSINLEEVPLYITYSPKGTYLIFCRADWKSLSINRAKDGKNLALMQKGFGIVSYLALSQSEKNIMTYQPSGRIVYRDLQTEKEIKTVDTLANLSKIRIFKNRRYLIAQSRADIVVVDLLEGRTVASSDLPGIISIAVTPSGNRLFCLSKTEGKMQLTRWYFTGGFLYSTGSPVGL